MSDRMPTIVESLGNEIARVRKGQNITAGDLAQRLEPWLSNLLVEKQAEALLAFADANRMPWTLFAGDTYRITVGDLLRAEARRLQEQ